MHISDSSASFIIMELVFNVELKPTVLYVENKFIHFDTLKLIYSQNNTSNQVLTFPPEF